jgi:hypothetical protein
MKYILCIAENFILYFFRSKASCMTVGKAERENKKSTEIHRDGSFFFVSFLHIVFSVLPSR